MEEREVKQTSTTSEPMETGHENNDNLDARVSLAIKKRHIPVIIGTIGTLITVISCFLPFYTLNFFGMEKSIKYIEGDGIIVCICAVIAAVLAFIHKQRFSVVPVIGEVLLFCNTIFSTKDLTVDVSEDFLSGSYGAGFFVLILGILVSFVGIVLATVWKTDRSTMKGNIITVVVLVVLVALLVGLMFVGQAYENEKNYNEAVEQMGKGSYDDAISLFEELEDYKDSAEKLTESKYLKAKDYLNDGRYSDAKGIFEELGDYEDAADLIEVCDFGEIKDSYWDSSDLPDTIDAIKEKCPNLEEAREFVDEKIKEQLEYYDSWGDYEGALEFLDEIADKWDVKEEIREWEKKRDDNTEGSEDKNGAGGEESAYPDGMIYSEGEIDPLEVAGSYTGVWGSSFADINIYSSPESLAVGNATVYLDSEMGVYGGCEYSGELVPLGINVYSLEDGGQTILLAVSYDADFDAICFELWIDGEYVEKYFMTGHYVS